MANNFSVKPKRIKHTGVRLGVFEDIFRSFKILESVDTTRIYLFAFGQILLSLLDLIGIALIGVIGYMAASNFSPTGTLKNFLALMQIENSSYVQQLLVLSLIAVTTLVGRTLFSIIITRRILKFFSSKGADITTKMFEQLMRQPLLLVSKRSSQETLYLLTLGVEQVTMRVMATSLVFIADLSLIFIIATTLFIIDFQTALATLLFFGAIFALLHILLSKRIGTLGEEASRLSILSNVKIMEAVKSYRELFVANRQEQYINKVSILRLDLAKSLAEINFMPFIGKYVIEASMILGIMLLGATQFLFNSPVEAATTLSIFLAASTRIAPAILRAQQSLLQIKGALGIAGDTLTLFGELKESSRTREYYISRGILEVEKTFEPRIEIKNLHFGYPNSSTEIFEDFNLVIESGIVALTGPSGSGKSTLLDLILGLLDPTDGQIFLSNLRPRDAIRRWEGSISYAPQETILIDGTIRENITGGEEKKYSDEEIVESLVATDLYEFVMSLDKGLETQVGENGAQLSGGQKQRLGISRAILSKPRLLILDEATSSLDINSETKILKSLKSFSLDTTILFVTHRISTLENIQKIIYMRNGRIIASGNFAQIGELFLELNEDL